MTRPVIPTELIAPAFNPATFGRRGEVHELFRRLRRDYPLAVAEVPGFDPHWIVTRHADLREITRQDKLFLNSVRSKTLASQVAEHLMRDYSGGAPHIFRTLVHMDEPEHAAYRQVTQAEFMPQSLEKLDGQIRATARRHIEHMARMDGVCDFAADIAFVYPLEIVLDIIGVPAQDHAKMLRLTQWLFSYADPDLCRPGANTTDPAEIIKTWDIVYREFREYYEGIIQDRRACPRGDVATLIANGKVNGCPMEERAMISYFVIASTAGHDTTAATTASAMWVLAEQPELLARMKANPGLIPGFVEESIRWATPVQQFVRSAAEDYTLRGQRIARGDLLYLSYVSANRDEEVFDDPYTFNPGRSPNKHIALGYGGHVCLGQHLARREMRILWEELLPRLESVEMAGEGRMSESEFVCGPKSVPIRYNMGNA